MNKHKNLLLAIFFLIIPAIFFHNVFAQVKNNADKYYNVFGMHYYSNPVKPKLNKEIKEKGKYDEPDMFDKFQHEIRTRDGKSSTDYGLNYLMQELTKSQQRSRLFKTTALNWVERGPGNVSGRTRGIIVDTSDATNKTWFAGSVSGGIWKTTNAGISWVNKTQTLPNLATTVLAQAPSNLNTIYCGTGEGFANLDAVNGAGIFKSTDRGETWVQLSSTANFNFRNVNRIIVSPTNHNLVLACTNPGPLSSVNPGGVWRSTDGGLNWQRTLSTSGNKAQDLKADPSNFSIQYCAVNNDGVYKSTDGGLNWVRSSNGLTTNGRIEIAVSGKNPNYIYASAQTSTGSGLFLSEDKGVNWMTVNSSDGKTYSWLGNQGWYDNAIAVHPDNEKIVFLGGIQLWRAEIGTPSPGTRNALFTQITSGSGQSGKPYVHVDHHNITPVPLASSPGTFWIINGNDGGVAYSTNGGITWGGNAANNNLSNGGYNTTQFYGVDKKPGANEYIGGMQDNGTWISPKGQDASAISLYKEAIGGDGFDVSWHYKDPNKIIGGSQYNTFYRSTDGGTTWNPATKGLEDVGSGKGVFVSRIAKSNSDPDVIYTTGSQGVWRSEDFGASWSKSLILQPKGWSYSGTSTPVAVSIADPQVVWAGYRFANTDSRLFVSKDGGITFDSVYKPTGIIAPGSISGIDTHPTEMNTAFITYSFSGAPKIIRTTDLGKTWEDISGFGFGATSNNGYPDVATYCVLVMPYDLNIIWAGTEIGLFESTDKGISWRLANNGLPAVSIWDMKIVNDQVVLATHGRGIFSVTLPQLSGYEPPAVTLSPVITALSQSVDKSINLVVSLRSIYDSTLVTLNGQQLMKLNASNVQEKTFNIIPTFFGKTDIQVTSYKSGRSYKSSLRSIELYNLKPTQVNYSNFFDEPTDDFAGNGFTISKPANFLNTAVNSPHPYSNSTDYHYNLLVPIKISWSQGLANIEYNDIALIEPGELNTVFGDSEFWDYVVVEGSRDGLTWIPFEDGYDSRYNSSWLSLYNSSTNPASSHYVSHKIDMTKTFNRGEVILVRFRLYADENETGWGWIIDNLKIQPGASSVETDESLPAQYSLSQNYPNPFNPETTIKFSLPRHSKVKLEIFDAIGRSVDTLVDSELDAGTHRYIWSGTKFSSGVYFYRISANEFSSSKKLILMK